MLAEDRNCGCNSENNCMDNDEEMNCNCKNNIREEIMMKIKSYKFSIVELGLYLDTHPDDEKALCLHREYTKKVKDLEEKYQKMYGPLSIYYPCKKWRWLEEPWVSFCLEEIATCLQKNIPLVYILEGYINFKFTILLFDLQFFSLVV